MEWDGSNNVGRLGEDGTAALMGLTLALEELPEVVVWPVAEYLQALGLSEL